MRLKTIFEDTYALKIVSRASTYGDPLTDADKTSVDTFHDADEFHEDTVDPKAHIVIFNDGIKVFEYAPRDYDWPEHRLLLPSGEIYKIYDYPEAEKLGVSQYIDILHDWLQPEREWLDTDTAEFRKIFGK